MAQLNIARSRRRPLAFSCWRIAQMCFGFSGAFGPDDAFCIPGLVRDSENVGVAYGHLLEVAPSPAIETSRRPGSTSDMRQQQTLECLQ
jgi:hypothetical protein